MHGLLRGAALTVHRGARHRLVQAGGQPAGTGDIAGQRADGVDAAEDDVVVVLLGNRVAPHQFVQHMGTEIGGVDLGQAALAPPGGAAQGVDYVGFGHGIPRIREIG
ncbi:hypothetical protein D3C84_933070 [compost metagenome]